jgi:hypothetical protein
MQPIVFPSRANLPGGLWTDKLGGEFIEGDPASTKIFIEGRCDVREFHMNQRLFFEDIKLTKRKVIVSDAEKESFLVRYRELIAKQMGELGDDEELTEAEKKRMKEDEEKALEAFIKSEQEKDPDVPRLTLYLSMKRPKTRMADGA